MVCETAWSVCATATMAEKISALPLEKWSGLMPIATASRNGGAIFVLFNANATQANTYPAFFETYPGSGTNWLAGAMSIGISRPAGETNKLTVYVYNYNTGAALLTSTNGIIGSGYKHVAITRSGNTWRLFINGALEATATWSGSVHSSAQKVYFGGDPWSGADGLTGQGDDYRITVGKPEYTAAFTPPPAPFPNSA